MPVPPPTEAPFPSLLDLNKFEFERFQVGRLNLQRALRNRPFIRLPSWCTPIHTLMCMYSTSHSRFWECHLSISESARAILDTDELAPPLKDSVRTCRPRRHGSTTAFRFWPTNVPIAPRTRKTTSVPNNVIASLRRRSASAASSPGTHVFPLACSTVLGYIT